MTRVTAHPRPLFIREMMITGGMTGTIHVVAVIPRGIIQIPLEAGTTANGMARGMATDTPHLPTAVKESMRLRGPPIARLSIGAILGMLLPTAEVVDEIQLRGLRQHAF